MADTDASINGFLVLDKPVGPSSMRAVAVVRRRAGGRKTGHGGTLDPRASGVLVLGLGKATRQLEQVVATAKRYETEVDLSIRTATDDLEAEPIPVDVAVPPTPASIREALRKFQGDIMQAPPAFSAVKVNGRRAYALARKDQPVDLPPRPVRVDHIELLEYAWPMARIDIACGKGFYVRSLARDLGTALGTGGCCASIRRTAVGPFSLDEAVHLDDVPDPLSGAHLIGIAEAMERIGGTP
ncbi:MAG: tRNA pseudouridine(55) synthase TruB [Phycisphaerales bacterium]|jgi:tRNA pseudouridine55 synthase|nr:tRNA pseudouridine(55) synthase TruB [Phycisphaerales bacterium]